MKVLTSDLDEVECIYKHSVCILLLTAPSYPMEYLLTEVHPKYRTPSPTLYYGHPFAENQTIRQLYHIDMAITKNQVECNKDVSNVVDIICYNSEKY